MTVTKNEKREKSQVCCGFSRHLVKQSLRGFFDKMLSDLQNQFLYHDFAILSPRRAIALETEAAVEAEDAAEGEYAEL